MAAENPKPNPAADKLYAAVLAAIGEKALAAARTAMTTNDAADACINDIQRIIGPLHDGRVFKAVADMYDAILWAEVDRLGRRDEIKPSTAIMR